MTRLILLVTLVVGLVVGGIPPAVAASNTGATGDARCDVKSFEMTWGVKESFRSYLSGTIARGGWETAGNITYDTPFFTFFGSSGHVSAAGDRGELSGFGRIDFTGHGGFLDQRFSAPKLIIESSDRAALYFAISGETQEGQNVEESSVHFADVTIRRYSVDPGAGVWTVRAAPVVLTEDGSVAFGTYPAGETLDPMDIVIKVTPNCLERDNLVALFLVGGGGVFAVAVISFLVWRRVQEST